MDIAIDTSALLAVILAEPERDAIVERTRGHGLIGPGSIPWEIGNAFSAMLRRRRLGLAEAQRGLAIFQGIDLRLVAVDLGRCVTIAHETGIYAYDAYFLDCAGRHAAPLLTLDHALERAAKKVGVKLLEV
ncbi:MAG: type II toxin-antitoxin system VapC family toxin [Acidobacteriota bacterium]